MPDTPEFCLACWRELKLTNDLPRRYIVSLNSERCEICGKWTPITINEKSVFEDWVEFISHFRTPPET